MARDPPVEEAQEEALRDAVRKIYKRDKLNLTVNAARRAAEKKLRLPEGWFQSVDSETDWKTRSKQIVHETLTQIETEEDAASAPVESLPVPMPSLKKVAPKSKSKAMPKAKPKASPLKKKRAKRAVSSDEEEFSDVASDVESVAEFSDASEPESKPKAKPKPTAKSKAGPAKNKRAKRTVSSDEEELSGVEPEAECSETSEAEPTPKTKPRNGAAGKKRAAANMSTEDEASDESKHAASESDEPQPAKKRKLVKPAPSAPAKSEPRESSPLSEPAETPKEEEEETKASKEDTTQHGEGDSDTSVVYDEPPKPRGRGKAAKSVDAPKKRKSKDAPKAAPKPASSDLPPDDALIKQLQGQLVKCGVRKVWGVELKKCGDDKKAKIRHLKGMLADIGMTGRFSEAKAREIKEKRELLAELGAVMEGEKSWGLSSKTGRRSRPTRPLNELSAEGSEDEGGKKGSEDGSGRGSDSDEDGAPPVRKGTGSAKRRADLAFLGDESESD